MESSGKRPEGTGWRMDIYYLGDEGENLEEG